MSSEDESEIGGDLELNEEERQMLEMAEDDIEDMGADEMQEKMTGKKRKKPVQIQLEQELEYEYENSNR